MGVKMALGDDHEVVAIVGDGTYQMLPMEIATIVSEGLKVIIVLLQNHGFASIGALSRVARLAALRHAYRMRNGGNRPARRGRRCPRPRGQCGILGRECAALQRIAEFRENYARDGRRPSARRCSTSRPT
jgi:3D-(3,5/4)-trihydroxycyclohexane-1,2-dione acylhydrolase (decyclizing)